MQAPTPDKTLELVSNAALASALFDHVKPLLADLEKSTITNLIMEYHNGTLNEVKVMSGIAEIAGYRKLLGRLESQVKRGEAAARALNQG